MAQENLRVGKAVEDMEPGSCCWSSSFCLNISGDRAPDLLRLCTLILFSMAHEQILSALLHCFLELCVIPQYLLRCLPLPYLRTALSPTPHMHALPASSSSGFLLARLSSFLHLSTCDVSSVFPIFINFFSTPQWPGNLDYWSTQTLCGALSTNKISLCSICCLWPEK